MIELLEELPDDGNWESSMAWVFWDSEFGTLRVVPETLNETEEKKLGRKNAAMTKATIQTTIMYR
jgi:hypothetical protein